MLWCGYAGSSSEVKTETDSNDAMEIKTEADSNDITEYALDVQTSTGRFANSICEAKAETHPLRPTSNVFCISSNMSLETSL